MKKFLCVMARLFRVDFLRYSCVENGLFIIDDEGVKQ